MPCARVRLAAVVLAFSVAGCGGGDKPCLSMGAMSDVLARAQLVRLDVYDAAARCDGARIADGAAPPMLSKAAVAGQPITLDVPAGHHALVLSAFADAAGTALVGSACVETDVRANQPACFDLTLADLPDAGSGDDLASSDDGGGGGGGDLACSDVTSDVSNCGACGRACSSAHVTAPACADKLCAPACAAGWADCNHPIAPAADDGCETNVYDPAHCGACGAPACNLANASAACPAGACTVKSCNAGFFDCDAKAANGCECAGKDSGGGGCCAGGSCQTAHTDGFGNNFYDCETTYTETLARDAAKASGFATPFGNTCGANMTEKVICGQSATACTCWVWADSAANNPATGRARRNTANNTCYCPNAGDQPWN